MRRYRGSKRLGEQRAFQDMQGDVLRYMRKKLDIRLTALAPAPVSARDVYASLFTTDQLRCIALLNATCPKLMNLESDLWVAHPAMPSGGIKVSFGKAMPCPPSHSTFYQWQRSQGQQWSVTDLPEWMQERLNEWAPIFTKISSEHIAVIAHAEAVFKHCNTVGQVVRLWPTLISCLPPEKRQKVLMARMKSKHSDMAVESDDNGGWKVLDMFAPSATARYDEILAEAFALPDSLPEDQPVALKAM